MSEELDTAALDAWLAEHLLGRRPQAHLPAISLSTTGDGMLMVLEAMQGRGWQALSHLFPDDSLRHATFIPEDVSATTEDWVSADSLPLAVAQAARAALEAKP